MKEKKKGMASEQESPEILEGVEERSPEKTRVQEGEGTLEEECAEILAQKDEEIKQLHDRILRLAAETDNTRKRLEREKSEGICFANESLIREVLPVVDNLERAIQHSEQNSDAGSLLEGVRMTLKAFSDVLAKFGCVPFDAVGETFDPRYHEAMLQQEAPGPENIVLQEFQKGYKLNDRLLRPALVVVSKASSGEQSEK